MFLLIFHYRLFENFQDVDNERKDSSKREVQHSFKRLAVKLAEFHEILPSSQSFAGHSRKSG